MLATEVWQALIGRRSVQSNHRLSELLREELSFEVALARAQADPFTQADYRALEDALFQVFVSMDREIARLHQDVNRYLVNELLWQFWGSLGNFDAAYMFTLNQDLWPERYFDALNPFGAAGPTLPGLQPRPGHQSFMGDAGPYNDSFVMQPATDPAATSQLRRSFNIIKLHGAFNWRTADGRNAMVVGAGKYGQIAESPLLSWYFDIFKRVLCSGSVRLMIVGYGFGDDHINAVIADAVENHALKVFIWNTDNALEDRVQREKHGASIWKGLLSTATRQMIDVFPTKQVVTEEYRRIVQTMFGRN